MPCGDKNNAFPRVIRSLICCSLVCRGARFARTWIITIRRVSYHRQWKFELIDDYDAVNGDQIFQVLIYFPLRKTNVRKEVKVPKVQSQVWHGHRPLLHLFLRRWGARTLKIPSLALELFRKIQLKFTAGFDPNFEKKINLLFIHFYFKIVNKDMNSQALWRFEIMDVFLVACVLFNWSPGVLERLLSHWAMLGQILSVYWATIGSRERRSSHVAFKSKTTPQQLVECLTWW